MNRRETQIVVPDWPVNDEQIRAVFQRLQVDGSWGRYHGPHCETLAAVLADFLDVEHIHLCCSGTSAVELALRAAAVQPADEVILSAYDFKANFVNVLTLNASPVLVDTLPHAPVINPDAVLAAITPKTRAIIVSHLHGCLADVSEICRIATAGGITVIEDACQVPGAMLGNRRAGTAGDVGVFSFGGSKLLTAGRGGAVFTSDAILAQRIRLFTQRGNDAYPLSEMQAALLLPQLRQLDARNNIRNANLRKLLHGLSGTELLQRVVEPTNCSAFYKVPFRIVARDSQSGGDAKAASLQAQISAAARTRGVPLDAGFSALHRIHSGRRFRAAGTLDNAEAMADSLLLLHHTLLLSGPETITAAAKILNDVCRNLLP